MNRQKALLLEQSCRIENGDIIMKTRKLRDLTVSEIGMGCMGFSHGYGQIPDEKYSIEAIRKAYEYGCNFFDTAEKYGPDLLPENMGHNECIVGKAVKDFRSNVVLATKLHIATEEPEQDGSVYNTIRRHVEASLERLQTKYIDLYYLHRVNPDIPLEEIAEAMGRLIKEGIIRGWGMSMVTVDFLKRVQDIAPVSAVQNIYSMMERDYEKSVIPYCLENNIGFVSFSPIASGYLSGKVEPDQKFEGDDVRKWVPQFKRENLIANKPLLDVISDMAVQKNVSNAQISLAWMLYKYPHVVPIPGSKNQERILENLGACEAKLMGEEFRELEDALGRITIHGQRRELGAVAEYID